MITIGLFCLLQIIMFLWELQDIQFISWSKVLKVLKVKISKLNITVQMSTAHNHIMVFIEAGKADRK